VLTPCKNIGCVPGTGIRTYVSNIDAIRDPQWNGYCPDDSCEALVYGGDAARGRGTGQGQNEWGVPSPYAQSFPLPRFNRFSDAVVEARMKLDATMDSGYTFPNEPPYSMNLYLNRRLVGDHIQLTGLLRNPKHLAPPPPPDWNFRKWQFTLNPADTQYINTINNVTFDLRTPGWLALEDASFEVDVCAPTGCQCYQDGLHGYWDGMWCDRCSDEFTGSYCSDSKTSSMGSSSSSTTGYIAAIVVLLLIMIASILMNVLLYRRIRVFSTPSQIQHRPLIDDDQGSDLQPMPIAVDSKNKRETASKTASESL